MTPALNVETALVNDSPVSQACGSLLKGPVVERIGFLVWVTENIIFSHLFKRPMIFKILFIFPNYFLLNYYFPNYI